LLRWRAWEDLHFGEPELHLLKYLVDPNRIALDIGAAEGVYLFHLKRLALHCVAFEPNPTSFEHLQRAIRGVEIYQAAVSTIDGYTNLRIPIVEGIPYQGWGTIEPKNQLAELPNHAIEEIRVRMVCPDQIALGDVGFIKIDVEGHEVQVLAGLSNVLSTCLPNLLIEVGGAQRGGSLSEVRRKLDPLGYICLKLNKDGLLVPVPTNFEIEDAMNVIFISSKVGVHESGKGWFV
jgi:FkbM family methyltransferase